MHDVSKQKKSQCVEALCVDHTENLPPGRWGRSVLCREHSGASLARVVSSCGKQCSWLGEKMQKEEEALTAHMSLCQIWLTLHQQEEQLAVWSMFACIVPRLCRHAHLWHFGNAHVWGHSASHSGLSSTFSKGTVLGTEFMQTAWGVEK